MRLRDIIRSIVLPFRPIAAEPWENTQHNDTGHYVSKQLCLGYPPIRRAVMLIANAVAKLPIDAIRYLPDGSKKKERNHAGYQVLNEECSPYETCFHVKRELVIDAIFGNGLAWIRRDQYASPTGLLVLDPDTVEVRMIDGEPWYKMTLNGNAYTIPASDIFHLRGPGKHLLADPLVEIAKDALGLSLSLQTFSAKYFKQGRAGTTVVEMPPGLADEGKRKQFIHDWRVNYEGQQQAHRTLFAPFGAKVNFNDVDNEKSQLLSSRAFDLIQISNLFSVEPHLLGSQVTTSYSSLVEQNQSHLDNCLDPWLCAVEGEANLKLRTESEKRLQRIYFEFERKALLSMDAVSETNLIKTQLDEGLISEEYARRVLNLPAANEEETYRRPNGVSVVTAEPEPAEPTQEPVPQDLETADSELQRNALATAAVTRLLTRIAKSKGNIEQHRQIWNENLSAFANSNEVFTRIAEQFGEELAAVLPEQRQEIVGKIDIEEILRCMK